MGNNIIPFEKSLVLAEKSLDAVMAAEWYSVITHAEVRYVYDISAMEELIAQESYSSYAKIVLIGDVIDEFTCVQVSELCPDIVKGYTYSLNRSEGYDWMTYIQPYPGDASGFLNAVLRLRECCGYAGTARKVVQMMQDGGKYSGYLNVLYIAQEFDSFSQWVHDRYTVILDGNGQFFDDLFSMMCGLLSSYQTNIDGMLSRSCEIMADEKGKHVFAVFLFESQDCIEGVLGRYARDAKIADIHIGFLASKVDYEFTKVSEGEKGCYTYRGSRYNVTVKKLDLCKMLG